MSSKKNRIQITQTELKKLIIYDPESGDMYTKQGYKINNGRDTIFHLQGNSYELCDIAFIYEEGVIPKGSKVGFGDKDKHSLIFTNLYPY